MTQTATQFYRDILTTVVESPAIAYWARAQGRARRDGAGYVTSVTVRDIEDGGNGQVLVVNEETIRKGFEKAHDGKTKLNNTIRGYLITAQAEMESGNVDCECADVLVQLGLFGEIVYG